jgi:hypothetical protein
MIIDATTTTPTYVTPETAYFRRFESASTDSIPFLVELDRMLMLENANGYTFQATTKAHEHAKIFLEAAKALLGQSLIRPSFMPDGEGGIDIEWERGDRNVTLSCRGRANQNDFIYWEENGDYDGRDASLALLIKKLIWLADADA